jgi:lipoprotein-releasing system permease protein
LNTSFYIAKRLVNSKDKSFTRVIIGIAVAGLAVSVAIMLLSSAIISGFKREINSKIFGFWGHIHISDAGTQRNFELKPINIADEYYTKLQSLRHVPIQKNNSILGIDIGSKVEESQSKGGISKVQPYIIMPCLVETKNDMLAGLYKGVNADFNWNAMQRFMVSGQGLDDSDSSHQIVVSKIIANKLGLKLGQKLIVTFIKDKSKLRRAMTIKGIYNTGLEEYDERFVIGKAAMLQDILGWSKDQYSGIEVFTQEVDEMDAINEYIYAGVLPTDLYSETIKEKFPSIFEWLKLQDINEKIILQLMGIVAIINLITVLLILILERTQMVGTLKALGGSNWLIRKIFLYHASYILLIGLLIGNVLGLGIAFLQKFTGLIKLDEKNYYLDVAPIHVDWATVFGINIGAFLICILTLVIPSYLVSKLTPVKALKFD